MSLLRRKCCCVENPCLIPTIACAVSGFSVVSQVKLDWSGAMWSITPASYRIERRTLPSGSFASVGTTTGTTFTNTPATTGVSYEYRVVAISASFEEQIGCVKAIAVPDPAPGYDILFEDLFGSDLADNGTDSRLLIACIGICCDEDASRTNDIDEQLAYVVTEAGTVDFSLSTSGIFSLDYKMFVHRNGVHVATWQYNGTGTGSLVWGSRPAFEVGDLMSLRFGTAGSVDTPAGPWMGYKPNGLDGVQVSPPTGFRRNSIPYCDDL